MMKIDSVRQKWREIRSSSGFHNAVLFLVFVAVSTLFWLILALNDSSQNSFNVRVQITNVPDSVTFISDIPEKIHVSVRDKGSNLWRSGFLHHPTMHVDFKDYASGGVLRFTKSDILSALKVTFGATAQITTVAPDSLRLIYTDNKGKRVPVTVVSEIFPASGSTLEGELRTVPSSVYVYGDKRALDSIHSVRTSGIVLKDISETTEVEVHLEKIPGVRIIPSVVRLTVPIEPLVMKEAMVTLSAVNVPEGESLLLFPSRVPVDYYVAMSRLGDDDDASIELQVDFNDVDRSRPGRLPVKVIRYPQRIRNLTVKTDSVEYTIVRN